MSNWDAKHYLRFATERTRPAFELASRIDLELPAEIADLGCGPGNSTQILRQRWPHARIVGIDNSAEMLRSAVKSYPSQDWIRANLADWRPTQPLQLVYSNAALQWLPDHQSLIPRLFEFVANGGALAFQIPSSTFATVRTLIHAISHDPRWDDRMDAPRHALTMESPSYYYDLLAVSATRLDIWETEYIHVMDSKQSIVDWIASTGLRPFLMALDHEEERAEFLSQLGQRVDDAYGSRVDGRILYPFRRTFVIAYR